MVHLKEGNILPDSVTAYLIARAIGRRGTRPGARMFEKAFASETPAVMRLWAEMGDRIADRLEI